MNSNRFLVQCKIEELIGCYDPENLTSYLADFKSFEINNSNINALELSLKEDSKALYYKGILSIFEALNGIFSGRHSWPIIQLYYATYYLLRCALATQSIAIAKCKGVFSLKIALGQKPNKLDSKDARGEHPILIKAYENLASSHDVLLSNKIDNSTVYAWLMDKRNLVNYRYREFIEPDVSVIYPNLFDSMSAKSQILTYLNDNIPIYPFDPDHSCVATPLKLAQYVSNRLIGYAGNLGINERKKSVLNSILNRAKLSDIDALVHLHSPSASL